MASRRRSIKLNDQTIDALKQQMAAFEKKFGRPPGPNDPIFFDPDKPTPTFMTEEKVQNITDMIANTMTAAGMDPAMVYAFRKTGFIATRENWHLFSGPEKKEWQEAVHEWLTCETVRPH
jgi:integrase